MRENLQTKLKEHEEAIAAQVKRGEALNAELDDIGRTYDAMKENFQAKLKEHEEAIAAQIKRGDALNAELNDIGRDIARRQGAVTQLQVLLSELPSE